MYTILTPSHYECTHHRPPRISMALTFNSPQISCVAQFPQSSYYCFFVLFWSHIQWCSGLTLYSVLRNQSQWAWPRSYGVLEIEAKSPHVSQISYLLYYLSCPCRFLFIFLQKNVEIMESERPRISIICDLWEQSLAESQHSHLYSGVVTLPLLFVEKLKKKNSWFN